jgi:hypothetical protein
MTCACPLSANGLVSSGESRLLTSIVPISHFLSISRDPNASYLAPAVPSQDP